MARASDVYIEGIVIAVTDRAVLVRIKAVGTRASELQDQPEEWIPKSQFTSSPAVEDLDRDDKVEGYISKWVAEERGLV